jgi:hypothetical protein
MQKDLFGKKIIEKKRRTRLEMSLLKYDKDSRHERLERLKYINKIVSKQYGIAADMETVYIFGEAKMAFINGELISTILLSQAFIERRLQMFYENMGLGAIGKRGLKAIIDHAKKNHTIQAYLIEKIDELRKKRNPFVHLKEYGHEYNLSQRIFRTIKEKKPFKQPIEIIMEDAKAAISLMYAVFITKFD